MKWIWKGPLEGGVTQSLLQKFEEDPFCFVLYYGLGLEEPSQENQNLLWGNCGHKGLEVGLENPKRFREFDEADWYEVRAAVLEESKKVLHTSRTTFPSVMNMLPLYNDNFKKDAISPIITERQFRLPHNTGRNEVTLMGKVDGIFTHEEYGPTLIEHKCKGWHDKVKLRKEIKKDVQVNIYSRMMGTRRVIYDVILIPETQWACPAVRVGEAPTAYINRIYQHHRGENFPIVQNTHHWLDQHSFSITDESIELVFKRTINPIIDKLCMLYEYTLSDSFDPLNPDCYNHLFYERPIRFFDPAHTNQFEKSYYGYITGELPLESLKPVSHLFKELVGEG